MNEFSFLKFSGAGNDFVLFDKKINSKLELTPDRIKLICNRRFGIGADGVLIISDSPDVNFNMEYYNADGYAGSLCGNGARCAIKYSQLSNRLTNGHVKFSCNNQIYSGEVKEGDIVRFNLNPPEKIMRNFKIKFANQQLIVNFANTGSPHVVVKIQNVLKNPEDSESFFNDIDVFPVVEYGRKIRNHKDFAPKGTNVNFISLVDGNIKIRTYERGVESETLACGTGSVASAIISFLSDEIHPPITVLTKSGERLIVDFTEHNGKFSDISLTGPAKVIFKGEIKL